MSDRRHDLPNLDGLSPAQAAATLFQLRERDDQPLDNATLDAWLSESEANRSAWARVRDAYDVFEDPGAADRFAGMVQDARSLQRPPRARWLPYAAAASLAAIAGTTALIMSGRLSGPVGPVGKPIASATDELMRFAKPDFVTGVGQMTSATLPDGSTIALDASSAVDVAITGKVRMMRLMRGQATFDVAHDASKPFRVAAGGRIVTAIGTSFDVRVDDGGVRVFLMRGSVSIAGGDDPSKASAKDAVVLRPGQQFIAQRHAADRVVGTDAEHVLAWKQGTVEFNDEPLSRAVTEINRYSRVQLAVSDPKIGALKISGSFKAGDGARFARSLSVLYPVRVERVPDGGLLIGPARR